MMYDNDYTRSYPLVPFTTLLPLESSEKALSNGHGPNNHVIKDEGSDFAQLRGRS
jgi:hypothetical protein